MSDYRVICIERANGGVGHITGIGTGSSASQADKHWTVSEVRTAIRSGDTFHTVGASGRKAYIESWDIPGIRTKPDQSKDDNLEALRMCNPFK
jgi:hypothetical protein